MDGILTAAGIQGWLGGTKKLVHEWDTGVASEVQASKMTLFSSSAIGKTMPEAGGLTLVGKTTELGCSMVKEGQFRCENFVATHFGLQILPHGVYNETAANDKVAATITEIHAFIYRAYFRMFFGASNEPTDQGNFHDFPWGRGFGGSGMASTAAETLVTRGLINGHAGQDGAILRTAVRCNPDTKPRLEIDFPKGAVATTVQTFIRAHVLGVEGL